MYIRSLILSLLMLLVSTTTSATSSIRGDINKDSSVTIADVMMLVKIILGNISEYDVDAADVNNDKVLSVADVMKLVNIILNGPYSGSETGNISDDPAIEPSYAPSRYLDTKSSD